MNSGGTINLYLHTHWDREWYLPFETYRVQLVAVVKDVVAKLQKGELPNFLLDGQSCALEDVLSIEPGLEEPIAKLMKEGLLAGGPWYVLADQMLVSGESLVRNMKVGLTTTRRFGPPAMIGYCPDTFGHSADMPRILQGFGIDCAFVWRGVPELSGAPVFTWSSADGSSVQAHFLAFGYYQTAFHDGREAGELLRHLKRFAGAGDYAPIVPVGADHLGAPRQFVQQLQELRSGAASLAIVCQPLPDFASSWQQRVNRGAKGAAAVMGELRDNAASLKHERAYMLPGVLSSRLYLKRENRQAEHRLVKVAEPVYSLLHALTGMPYPVAELLHAWKLLLKNQPHDSICGCSIDEVHREMIYRWRKLHHTLNALDARSFEWVCGRGNGAPPRLSIAEAIVWEPDYQIDRVAVFNLSSDPISCPVLVEWAEPAAGAAGEGSGGSASHRALPADMQLVAKEREPLIFSGCGREPDVRVVDHFQAWIWADKIPALGLRSLPFAPVCAAASQRSTLPPAAPVQVESRRLSNGLIALEIDKEGELTVTEHCQNGAVSYRLRHQIRDSGDGGDTYSFDPLVGDEAIVAKVTEVKPWQRGPLVGSLQITYDIDIPTGLIESGAAGPDDLRHFARSQHLLGHTITTEISLRRGLPILFFDTRWVNHAGDHRLEVLFNTGACVEETFSENHFSIVRREHAVLSPSLPVDKGCEAPLDRFPCQRFFIANGQLFLNRGLPEYGADGSAVSLTALRAVSRLSRPRLRTRGGGAGPSVATPEANCLGLNEVSYGWAPLSQLGFAEQIAQAYRLSEIFCGATFAMPIRSGALPDQDWLCSLDNEAVRVVALYLDNESRIYLRLLNVTWQAQELVLKLKVPGASLQVVNLDHAPLQVLQCCAKDEETTSFQVEFSANQLLSLSFVAALSGSTV